MKNLLSILLLLLSISSCIELADVETVRSKDEIVITGRITNGSGPHYVYVSTTSENQRVTEPFQAQNITLVENDEREYHYLAEVPGTYVLPQGLVSGYPGHSYYIKIELPDGRAFVSTPEQLPTISARDTIRYELNTVTSFNENGVPLDENLFEVYLNSDITTPDIPQFIQWVVEEGFQLRPTSPPNPFGSVPDPCYFERNADPQRINVFSSETGSSAEIRNWLIAQRPIDYAFLLRYYSNIHQYSITRSHYEYLRQIQSNIEQSGSIFDIPPARIRGNLYNPEDADDVVNGYFSAALEKVTRFLIQREDIPYPLVDPCAYRGPFRSYPRICTACNEVAGFVPRPAYFP